MPIISSCKYLFLRYYCVNNGNPIMVHRKFMDISYIEEFKEIITIQFEINEMEHNSTLPSNVDKILSGASWWLCGFLLHNTCTCRPFYINCNARTTFDILGIKGKDCNYSAVHFSSLAIQGGKLSRKSIKNAIPGCPPLCLSCLRCR